MKIAIVVPKLTGGGAEYVAREWAIYLSKENVEVLLVTTDQTDDHPSLPLPVVKLAGSSLPKRVKNLRSLIRSENPDAIIGLMPYWNLLVLAATLPRRTDGPKVILSSHTIESSYGVRRGRGFALQTSFARLVYRFSDALIASSHAVAAEAVARYGIKRDRLWVIPNPVFPSSMAPGSPERLASPSGVPSTLVVPGRLVAQKRPGLAIDVASALGRISGTPPQVIFIGDGPAAESTRQRAEQARVKASFRSWNPDWPGTVPTNSVVLLPSMLEGFGNVLLDATASGLPVVASSRALGVADAIIPGVTGVLVCGDHASDYAEGVLSSSNLPPCDPLTIQGWINRFSSENSGAQLLSVVNFLLRPIDG